MHLQDSYKVNVCLLIGLRWLDESGKNLTDGEFTALQAHIHAWTQQVVKPLRSLRRLLKEPVAGYPQDEIQAQIRTAIKQAELMAEKKLLLEIDAWVKNTKPAQDAGVKSNIDTYLEPLGVAQNMLELLQRKM